jgi:hypothetical protein
METSRPSLLAIAAKTIVVHTVTYLGRLLEVVFAD